MSILFRPIMPRLLGCASVGVNGLLALGLLLTAAAAAYHPPELAQLCDGNCASAAAPMLLR